MYLKYIVCAIMPTTRYMSTTLKQNHQLSGSDVLQRIVSGLQTIKKCGNVTIVTHLVMTNSKAYPNRWTRVRGSHYKIYSNLSGFDIFEEFPIFSIKNGKKRWINNNFWLPNIEAVVDYFRFHIPVFYIPFVLYIVIITFCVPQRLQVT